MKKLLAVLAVATMLATAGRSGAAAAPSYDSGLWAYGKLGLAAAHQQSTGAGVIIGVLDNPVDPAVPDLRGQHVLPHDKGYCRAADGSYPATGSGPDSSHATAVTSLLVGNGHGTYQGQGIKGIAPGATVRTYAIGTGGGNDGNFSCTAPGSDPSTQAADAVRQAVDDGVRILNLSFAGSDYQGPLIFALGEAERRGVIVVASTYDRTTPGSVQPPATTNGSVVVNAVDSTGRLAPFSAGGSQVSVAAPGMGMDVGGFFPDWRSDAISDGSSFAAPMVCGALALVWSKYPHATANQVIQDLLNNTGIVVGKDAGGKPTYTNAFTRSPDAPAGYQQGNGYGYGIIDPLAMLAHDPAGYPDSNPLVRADGTPDPSALGATAGSASASSTSSTTPAAGSSGPATANTSGAAAAAGSTGSGGGNPGLIVAAVVLVLLLAAGIGVAVVRGRSPGRRTTSQNSTAR